MRRLIIPEVRGLRIVQRGRIRFSSKVDIFVFSKDDIVVFGLLFYPHLGLSCGDGRHVVKHVGKCPRHRIAPNLALCGMSIRLEIGTLRDRQGLPTSKIPCAIVRFERRRGVGTLPTEKRSPRPRGSSKRSFALWPEGCGMIAVSCACHTPHLGRMIAPKFELA